MIAIVNGAAASGRCGRRAAAVLAPLGAELWFTEGPGHATELAEKAAGQAERVLAVGGDGTTFEVLNGLFAADRRPALGIVPLGTGNSFLRDFELQEPEAAVAAIRAGRRRACDVVRATHDGGELVYLNLLSVGFSAGVGDLTNRRFKRLGPGGYGLAVLGRLATLSCPIFPHRLDGGPLDDRPVTLLSFSNSRFTGGTMRMAPEADPSDGALDVIRIGPMGRRRLATAFPKIFQGTHVAMPEVDQGRARRVAFDLAAPVAVMVDGEVLHLRLRALEVLPGAIEVLA